MESFSLVYKILVTLVWGIVCGFITIPLSKKLALSRTEDPAEIAPLNKIGTKVFIFVISIAATAGLTFTANEADLYIRNLLFLIPIISLSIVDALVRKIPNPLLLSMLIIETVYLIYHCISTQSVSIIPSIIVGFLVGMIVCLIPSILKIPIGAGDIKYSGVIGICVYAAGYFQSMVIMALLAVIYLLYLVITKKGGLKTQFPYAPFLSVGLVITMCFSIFDKLDVGFIL